jgi:hypothetical protein
MAASISPARKVARSVHAVLRYGRGHEHNEGAGRTANLEARSAKGRDKKPADDGGVESLRRRCTGGDGNRHGKGQRHDGDGQPSNGICPKLGQTVSFAQDRQEFRRIELRETWRVARLWSRCSHVWAAPL